MPNAKDLSNDFSRLKVLLVGKSGTRKSTIAASFPGPRYQFDFDSRIGGLRNVDIDYDTYTRASGWGKAEKKLDSFLEAASKGTLPYRTIHIASITSVLDFFLWEAKQHYANETSGGFRINRPGTVRARVLLMSDMPHYKFVHGALDSLLNDYIAPLSLVCNVVVEAHEATVFDKTGEAIGEKVLATPAISDRLPTTFDETWQVKFKRNPNPKEENDYRVWFRNNELAKTTFRQLPDSVCVTNKESNFYEEVFVPLVKGEK